MKKYSKFLKVSIMLIILSMVSPSVIPYANVITAQAATSKQISTVKISKKSLALEVGKSATLKVTGTKSKITWTTSDKTVAAVEYGKVTAKKAGTATITATVNKKKYTCKVTVTETVALNPYVADAPYAAQQANALNLSYVIPKDWNRMSVVDTEKASTIYYYPASADITKETSYLTVNIQKNGQPKVDYSTLKTYFTGLITQDYITAQLKQQDPNATVSDFKTSDYEAKLGTAFKTEYKAVTSGLNLAQTIYDLLIDNYLVEVTVTNIGDGVTPDITTAGEYLLNSIQVSK
jgi:hypothetical protein